MMESPPPLSPSPHTPRQVDKSTKPVQLRVRKCSILERDTRDDTVRLTLTFLSTCKEVACLQGCECVQNGSLKVQHPIDSNHITTEDSQLMDNAPSMHSGIHHEHHHHDFKGRTTEGVQYKHRLPVKIVGIASDQEIVSAQVKSHFTTGAKSD